MIKFSYLQFLFGQYTQKEYRCIKIVVRRICKNVLHVISKGHQTNLKQKKITSFLYDQIKFLLYLFYLVT